jgi:hypothetical protein
MPDPKATMQRALEICLASNLTAAPWIHFVLAGLNSNIDIWWMHEGINRHLVECKKAMSHN